MPKSEKTNYSIRELKKQLKQKNEYIIQLEKTIEAYKQFEEFARKELIEADKIIKAQEKLQELINKERIEADKTIKAHEMIEDAMMKEKMEADKIIKAQEIVQEMMKQQLIDKDKTIQAQEMLQNLFLKEKRDLYKTMEAHQIVEEMLRKELLENEKIIQAQEIIQEMMRREQLEEERIIQAHESLQELNLLEKKEAEKIIKAHENVKELSNLEMKQRDEALRKILEINKYISSILEKDILLKEIMTSLITSLNAQRGILFLVKDNNLIPELYYDFDENEVNEDYFKISSLLINNSFNHKKFILKNKEKISYKNNETYLSILVLPLKYENQLLGIIYIDIISNDEIFKERDLEIAEIFSYQAAISINNSLMYEKIKNKNIELVKLLNLKNQFISRLSDDLKPILNKIDEFLNKLKDFDVQNKDQYNDILNKIVSQNGKLQNIVDKVLTLSALEKEVNTLFSDNINFEKIIQEVLERHKQVIKEKNIQVNVNLKNINEFYKGNYTIIKTIFDEIISNAIFYNKINGKVDIIGYKDKGTVCFEFIDTGCGIREEDYENIFQQFYRLEDSEKYNERGAGLGLFMVKSCLANYNGKISLTSKVGEGSNFKIRFFD